MSNITAQEFILTAVDGVFSFGLSACGLLGNLCVVCAFLQIKLSTTNFFILNLAILDILTCLSAIIKQIIFLFGELSSNACPLLQYLLYFSTSASPFLLLAIAIDRYRKLCRLHRWQLSLKHAKIVMAATMLISAILSSPILFFYKLGDHSADNRKCEIQYKNFYSFIYFLVLFALLLSLVFPIVVCYRKVYRVIKTFKYNQANIAKKVQRSTITMCFVAIVFLLSYLPCLLIDVLDQKFATSPHLVARIFHCLATRSYLFSCMFNPILYGCRNQKGWSVIKTFFKPRYTVSWPLPGPLS